MSDETALAFGSLDQRAMKTSHQITPPDRISVRDHEVDVEIGAFQSERDSTQRLRFSVVVEVAPSVGAITDDVDDILSYDTVTEAITAELAAERLNLLETLAQRIADRILAAPQPLRVFVRIEKLDRGPGNLGVEIVRSRNASSTGLDDIESPQPRVLFLENTVLDNAELPALLDRLVADARPVILCVGAGSTPVPQVDDRAAQRHIDLLAIEQNAWRLAAIDQRCVVVGTRTELDWGMKNKQISVWAPAKLVLDAVDGPADTEPQTLAGWFAAEMGAVELTIVDGLDTKLSDLP